MEKFGLFKLLSPFLPQNPQETNVEEQKQAKPQSKAQAYPQRKYDNTRSYVAFMEQHSKHSAAAKKNK